MPTEVSQPVSQTIFSLCTWTKALVPKETSHVYWESRHANILNIMLLQLVTRFIANMTELQKKKTILVLFAATGEGFRETQKFCLVWNK